VIRRVKMSVDIKIIIKEHRVLEYFRGVVWPRGKINNKKKDVYLYTIVGILVTEEPIEKFENKHEICLDGMVSNWLGTECMADRLSDVDQTTPPYRLGDANSVLYSLGRWERK
jgi:hypothetical protein